MACEVCKKGSYVGVRLESRLAHALREVAQKRGATQSVIIREALWAYLAKEVKR